MSSEDPTKNNEVVPPAEPNGEAEQEPLKIGDIVQYGNFEGIRWSVEKFTDSKSEWALIREAGGEGRTRRVKVKILKKIEPPPILSPELTKEQTEPVTEPPPDPEAERQRLEAEQREQKKREAISIIAEFELEQERKTETHQEMERLINKFCALVEEVLPYAITENEKRGQTDTRISAGFYWGKKYQEIAIVSKEKDNNGEEEEKGYPSASMSNIPGLPPELVTKIRETADKIEQTRLKLWEERQIIFEKLRALPWYEKEEFKTAKVEMEHRGLYDNNGVLAMLIGEGSLKKPIGGEIATGKDIVNFFKGVVAMKPEFEITPEEVDAVKEAKLAEWEEEKKRREAEPAPLSPESTTKPSPELTKEQTEPVTPPTHEPASPDAGSPTSDSSSHESSETSPDSKISKSPGLIERVKEKILTPETARLVLSGAIRIPAYFLGMKAASDLVGLAVAKISKNPEYGWGNYVKRGTEKKQSERIREAIVEVSQAVLARKQELEGLPENADGKKERGKKTDETHEKLKDAVATFREKIEASSLPEAEKKTLRKELAMIMAEHRAKNETLETEKDKRAEGILGTYLATKAQWIEMRKNEATTLLALTPFQVARMGLFTMNSLVATGVRLHSRYTREALEVKYDKGVAERKAEKAEKEGREPEPSAEEKLEASIMFHGGEEAFKILREEYEEVLRLEKEGAGELVEGENGAKTPKNPEKFNELREKRINLAWKEYEAMLCAEEGKEEAKKALEGIISSPEKHKRIKEDIAEDINKGKEFKPTAYTQESAVLQMRINEEIVKGDEEQVKFWEGKLKTFFAQRPSFTGRIEPYNKYTLNLQYKEKDKPKEGFALFADIVKRSVMETGEKLNIFSKNKTGWQKVATAGRAFATLGRVYGLASFAGIELAERGAVGEGRFETAIGKGIEEYQKAMEDKSFTGILGGLAGETGRSFMRNVERAYHIYNPFEWWARVKEIGKGSLGMVKGYFEARQPAEESNPPTSYKESAEGEESNYDFNRPQPDATQDTHQEGEESHDHATHKHTEEQAPPSVPEQPRQGEEVSLPEKTPVEAGEQHSSVPEPASHETNQSHHSSVPEQPRQSGGIEGLPNQPEPPLEPTAYTETLKPRESVWKAITGGLEKHKAFEKLNEIAETKAKNADIKAEDIDGVVKAKVAAMKTYIIDAVKDEIEKNPEAFGLPKGAKLNALQPGQTINLESILGDESKIKDIIDEAKRLTAEEMESIVKNNTSIQEWAKKNPTEPLTAERVEQILRSEEQHLNESPSVSQSPSLVPEQPSQSRGVTGFSKINLNFEEPKPFFQKPSLHEPLTELPKPGLAEIRPHTGDFEKVFFPDQTLSKTTAEKPEYIIPHETPGAGMEKREALESFLHKIWYQAEKGDSEKLQKLTVGDVLFSMSEDRITELKNQGLKEADMLKYVNLTRELIKGEGGWIDEGNGRNEPLDEYLSGFAKRNPNPFEIKEGHVESWRQNIEVPKETTKPLALEQDSALIEIPQKPEIPTENITKTALKRGMERLFATENISSFNKWLTSMGGIAEGELKPDLTNGQTKQSLVKNFLTIIGQKYDEELNPGENLIKGTLLDLNVKVQAGKIKELKTMDAGLWNKGYKPALDAIIVWAESAHRAGEDRITSEQYNALKNLEETLKREK